MRHATDAGRRFFDLPQDAKMALRSRAQGSPRGYVPMGESVLARTVGGDSPPDIKEGFGMGPLQLPAMGGPAAKYYAENVWPAEPGDFRQALSTYYTAMQSVSAQLLRLFALALRLDPGYFDSLFAGHNSTLRLINYPAQIEVPADRKSTRLNSSHT